MSHTATANQKKAIAYLDILGVKYFQMSPMTDHEGEELFNDPELCPEMVDIIRGAAMTLGGFPLVDEIYDQSPIDAQTTVLAALEELGATLEHD